MRIALVATLAFSMIWFVALRPKPPAADPSTPAPASQPAQSEPARSEPAQSAPGKAAEKAQQAVGASQQSAERHESAAGATDSAPPAGSRPARPAEQNAAQPGAKVDV